MARQTQHHRRKDEYYLKVLGKWKILPEGEMQNYPKINITQVDGQVHGMLGGEVEAQMGKDSRGM